MTKVHRTDTRGMSFTANKNANGTYPHEAIVNILLHDIRDELVAVRVALQGTNAHVGVLSRQLRTISRKIPVRRKRAVK